MADTADNVMAVRPETFLGHWRDIRDAKDELGSQAMEVARTKKAAKRDGVDLDAVKLVEKLSQMESDERATFLAKVETYCKWIELPLGAFSAGIQVAVPKDSARENFTRWQAGQDGHKAGTDGTPRDANPHATGSAEHVEWDKKWSRSFKATQDKRAAAMAKNARAADKAASGSRASGKMAAAGEGLPASLN